MVLPVRGASVPGEIRPSLRHIRSPATAMRSSSVYACAANESEIVNTYYIDLTRFIIQK